VGASLPGIRRVLAVATTTLLDMLLPLVVTLDCSAPVWPPTVPNVSGKAARSTVIWLVPDERGKADRALELSTRSTWENSKDGQCGVVKPNMPHVLDTSIRLLTLDLSLREQENTGNSG
jgi:hypothetical protein